jgi:hypothetical protein
LIEVIVTACPYILFALFHGVDETPMGKFIDHFLERFRVLHDNLGIAVYGNRDWVFAPFDLLNVGLRVASEVS